MYWKAVLIRCDNIPSAIRHSTTLNAEINVNKNEISGFLIKKS
jgi:hypothetical protein